MKLTAEMLDEGVSCVIFVLRYKTRKYKLTVRVLAAVLIGDITGLARPSVSLSVCSFRTSS